MSVSASDLVVGYRKHAILDPIGFDLPQGSSCLVVGPNGAGKSSLLRTIVGLQPALRGNARVDEMLVPPNGLSALVPAGVRFLGQGDRGFPLLHTTDHRRV